MASRKRAHSDFSPPEPISPRNVKLKTDRTAQAATESNSESSYVSAAAAVFSDSGVSDTDHTDVGTETDSSTSSEESSTISSDSEDESDDESSSMRSDTTPTGGNDERRTNVRAGTKPSIRREETGGSLLQKLQNFLPEMKASNEELEREREEGTLGRRNIECSDEEDGPHIEMNLGLGVLEEKEDLDVRYNEREDSQEHEEDNGQIEEDDLCRLLGQNKQARTNGGIEEVGDG